MPEDDMMPIDTTGVDTTDNPVDTTGMGTPCDSNTVYFSKQILPILQSNCAFSGCHDAASAQDGVILESYEQVIQTADVRPFDLNGSDLYEVITEDDEDKRMPPPPNARLTSGQIQLIAQWILQGAENLDCDENAGECDTENMSFSTNIQPVITNNCLGCHSGGAPSGGINLSSYSGVKAVADNGRLLGAIKREPGFSPMPQGGDQLSPCTIDQFTAWIMDGAPNN
jgi:uncharacterized membrane protein